MEQQRILKRRRANPSSSILSSSQSSLLPIDRISTLPDPILHDIFNLLPTRCVARTSALSNRFNELWLTYPIMDLNEFDHRRNKFMDKLSDRMQRCYIRHDFTFLAKLKIRVREPVKKVLNKNLSLEVDRFILRAYVANTLKEIQLQFPISKRTPTVQDLSDLDKFYRRYYLLPKIPLFSFCKSVKCLKLKGCRFEGNVYMSGDGIILPFLQELYIKYCVIPDDNFVSKFIDGCPQLENLSIKFCLPGRMIQFSSSKLKTLVLGSYDSPTIFQVVAPNLKTLKITGTKWKHTINNSVGFQPRYNISAPNLETLCFKEVYLSNESITNGLSTFTRLKELEIYECGLTNAPNFESQKIEKLAILRCVFHGDQLNICSSKLPQIKLVNLYLCTGLKRLTLRGRRGLKLRVQGCSAFKEFHRIIVD